jgi:hypothetical protein
MFINYTKPEYEFGLTISNLFGVTWKVTQFATETRLKGQTLVNGIAFTPGTKFASILHLSYFL